MNASRWPYTQLALAGAAAVLVGALLPKLPPALVVVALVAGIILTVVILHPPVAAYMLIGLTPLIAGINRGAFIALLRPSEALAVLLGLGLGIGGLLRMRTGLVPKLTVTKIDLAIIIFAFFGSVVPLLWLLARHIPIQQDDLLYALPLWKLYGVYLIVRLSVRTAQQVERCLWIAMFAACVVAFIAMLQALEVPPVTRFLSTYFAPYGDTGAVTNERGGATLGLPIAVADLMVFNLTVAIGLLLRNHRRRTLLMGMAAIFVCGSLASGQFSGAIALVIAVITIAVVTRRFGLIARFAPIAIGAGLLLRPVINKRLQGFQSPGGLPISWAGRLFNLRNYFWPVLRSHSNYLLGVRPSARIASSFFSLGYIWIESGYTWLLWGGGIPFLLSFLYFMYCCFRTFTPVSRTRSDAVGAAALSVVVAMVIFAVLMTIDPHITYRGSGEFLFALLALASPSIAAGTAPVSISQSPKAVAR